MELAVDRVICAGITRELRLCVVRQGIDVQAGFCGAIDEVIDAYLCGRLSHGDFNMPGSTWESRGLHTAQGIKG